MQGVLGGNGVIGGGERLALFGGLLRARWVIVNTGTANASFTFKVTAYLQG